MQTGVATVANSMEVAYKTKNKVTGKNKDPAKPTPGHVSGGNSLEKIHAPQCSLKHLQ